MTSLRILVACEESGVVRDAFIEQGHFAESCDLLPSRSSKGVHWQEDVIGLLEDQWDMIIAFPPCTHLASSGAKHFEQKRKDGRQQAGIDFFMEFVHRTAHPPRIAPRFAVLPSPASLRRWLSSGDN